MSWVSAWAEKGGSFLDTLDSRVANIFNNTETPEAVTHPAVVSRVDEPQTQHMLPNPQISKASFAVVPPVNRNKAPSRTTSRKPQIFQQAVVDNDEALFDFLNNPLTSVDHLSTNQETLPPPTGNITLIPQKVDSPAPSTQLITHNPEGKQARKAKDEIPTFTDLPITESHQQTLENRLLHNEVTALNQEVSDLLKRRQKSEEESHQLRTQVEKLTESLALANRRVRELASQSANQREEEQQRRLNELTSDLEATRNSLLNRGLETQEALRQVEFATLRANQLQQEATRATGRLTEYKEKAACILAAKDKAIADLQSRCNNICDPGSTLPSASLEVEGLRGELELLRDEVTTLRGELERRDVSASELEGHWQRELTGLRRSLAETGGQLEREQQMRRDTENELIELQRNGREQTERFTLEKAELHSLIQSNEAELARMRRALAERTQHTPSPQGNFRAPPPRTEAEQILALESKVRQLTDSLVTKQDALEATLAQNHGLKIRLERFVGESDAHLLTSANSKSEFSSSLYLPISSSSTARSSTTSGFARLHLIDTSLPGSVRGFVTSLDGVMIQVVSFLRRRPLFRLLFIFYLFIVHLWFFLVFFVFSPFPVFHPLPPN